MASTPCQFMFVCSRCLTRLRPAAKPRLSGHSTAQERATFSAIAPILPRAQSRRPTTPHLQSPSATATRQLHFQRSVPYYQSESQTPSKLYATVAALPRRRQLQLSGPDAPKFLQGLVTHNVDSNNRSSFYTAFLDARGRVLWDAFVWISRDSTPREWMCWIEVDESELDAVLRHLKRHKLRSKLAIQEAKGTVYAGWDFSKDAVACFSKLESGGVLFMEDPRAEGAGLVRLFDPHTQRENGPVAPKISELLDNAVGAINFTNAEDYRLQRYLLGIPEGPTEIPRESALPMEANFDLNQAIDFKKGCYVGQELTIRTKHTGVVRKRILPVQIYRLGEHIRDGQEGAVFDPAWTLGAVENNPEKGVAHSLIGADIKQLDEEGEIKKGRSAGKFIAGIGNVGLALCRLEMMTDMRVSAEGGSWRPGMEFGIRVGGDADGEQPNNGKGEVLRVKPFVFDWFKERERALWEKGRGKARA